MPTGIYNHSISNKIECICKICGKTFNSLPSRIEVGGGKFCSNTCRIKGTYKNITGKKFGRLTAISFIERRNLHSFWKCICDCGNKTIVNLTNLQEGHTKSCGCYNIEIRHKANLKHGFAKDKTKRPFYNIFIGIFAYLMFRADDY